MATRKSVLIVGYYFKPDITPRAFRTYELARELAKMCEVVLLLPEGSETVAFAETILIPAGIFFSKKKASGGAPRSVQNPNLIFSFVKRSLKKLIEYILPGGLSIEFGFSIWRARSKLRARHFDGLISIGLPIGVHFGSALLQRFERTAEIAIADYGDPFSKNPTLKSAFWSKLLERWILKQFDFVCVPVKEAIAAYTGLLPLAKIFVAPQGLDFKRFKTEIFKPNSVPRIGYAGVFYEGIRDPQAFFQRLGADTGAFVFDIYTDTSFTANLRLIDRYRSTDRRDRIRVHPLLAREDCVATLSQCDFLINFENQNGSQSPSKLIDYTLAKRPILTIAHDGSNIEDFFLFLAGDFRRATRLENFEDYDIAAVTEKFLVRLRP